MYHEATLTDNYLRDGKRGKKHAAEVCKNFRKTRKNVIHQYTETSKWVLNCPTIYLFIV